MCSSIPFQFLIGRLATGEPGVGKTRTALVSIPYR